MPPRFLSLDERERFRLAGQLVEIHDYPYHPEPRTWSHSPLSRLIEQGADGYGEILRDFVELNDAFRRIPVLPDPANEATPAWDNTWLPGFDAVALYGMVAKYKPRRYVEIGSGNSTKFVRRAIIEQSPGTKLISIGPGPTTAVESICDEAIRLPLESAPLDIFSELQAGDILFIDNSHRSFQNSDVTVIFGEVIPRLAPGVIYALHDIFLPWDYPADWDWRFYNEQYLLMAYLLGGGGGDRILFPAHYVSRAEQYVAAKGILFLGAQNLAHLSSSFWMVRGDHQLGTQ